jgi:hypothetical protein
MASVLVALARNVWVLGLAVLEVPFAVLALLALLGFVKAIAQAQRALKMAIIVLTAVAAVTAYVRIMFVNLARVIVAAWVIMMALAISMIHTVTFSSRA